jgi:regulator of cell morphogenesis and NO signaling
MNPIASLTLREAIRSRPAGVGILEARTGAAFWNRLDATVAEFCAEAELDLEELQHAIASLPANLERQDWLNLPLYLLVEHLTAGHRLFRSRDLPEIHRLLERLRAEFPAGHESLEILLREFKSFRREFAWHMEEEEEFLYPKILRLEASLRYPDLYPEVYKGSVAMFPKQQLHGPEHLIHDIVTGLSERLNGLIADAADAVAAFDALEALRGYEARLKAHIFLETEILFPRAMVLEATLLQRTA